MTAANIVNQAGVVYLAALEDLTYPVSLIKGDNVALSAGRDINLIAGVQSGSAYDLPLLVVHCRFR
jgi:hypothetical protein